jgi:hypothetical protein
MTRNTAKHDALLDELLKDYTDPKDILGVHDFGCQMHPPHLGGQLLVLPTR